MTLEERLNREIDRESTPEESERLREELEAQPETRATYEQLLQLVRTLDAVQAEEPPLDLGPAVMRAVRGTGVPSSHRWPGIARVTEALRQAFARRPVLGFSLTMAMGVLVGALVGGAGQLSQIHPAGDDRSAAAAMIAPKGLAPREVDRTNLSGEGFRAEAALWAAGDQAEVRVRVDGEPPFDLAVACDGPGLEAVGLEKSLGASGRMQLGPMSLHVVDAGPGDYVLKLVLRKRPARVEVTVGRGQDRAVAALNIPDGS